MHTKDKNVDMSEKEKKIREFLNTLTVKDIADSVHLIDMDFATCEIDDIDEAIWILFLEYQALKQQGVCDYITKKNVVKKILSCQELEELVIEKGINDYFERENQGKVMN